MNRTILFRAKQKSDGQWFHGNLMCYGKQKYISVTKVIPWQAYFIDDDTIGQYTGVKDINGKMVFEGDVVFLYADTESRFIVQWSEEWLCFLGHSDNETVTINKHTLIEVIGNIYDNPELIENK